MSESDFERRVAAALHAPLQSTARGRAAVMARVRAVAPAERPVRRGAGRIEVRHSLAGLALAASLGSVAMLSPLLSAAHDGGRHALATAVIGDSVGSTLHDTLRLVRLIFADSTARRVAAVGEFNGWHADSTPMQRDPATGRWSATVALRDGAHRYAFVVDATRWALDPDAPRGRDADGRLYSLLNVTAKAN